MTGMEAKTLAAQRKYLLKQLMASRFSFVLLVLMIYMCENAGTDLPVRYKECPFFFLKR